jgi:hypothetical protein
MIALVVRRRSFSGEFDDEFPVGAKGLTACVGCNVLRGLIAGVDEFLQTRPRRESSRDLGPALLGAAPWLNDSELIAKLNQLSGTCIVITKQGRTSWDLNKLQELHRVNAVTPGLPLGAFPALAGLAPRVDDQPALVGPYDRLHDVVLPAVRTLGFRPQTKSDFVPLMHAKLVLLGELWWHDVDALGHVTDVIGFTPRKLWVSSANFTRSSRDSLEFGYWTEEPALVEGIERFLLKLVASSEGLDGDEEPKPQLLPVEYDDEAFAEVMAEMEPDEEDDEEDY